MDVSYTHYSSYRLLSFPQFFLLRLKFYMEYRNERDLFSFFIYQKLRKNMEMENWIETKIWSRKMEMEKRRESEIWSRRHEIRRKVAGTRKIRGFPTDKLSP